MLRALRQAVLRVEGALDGVFGATANPARHLGALAFHLFWIVAVTGIYLYAAFDTSVAGAHASVARISSDAWPASGFARTLHRYASDALAVIVVAHLAREWLQGHARGFRWFSWITGVPLLWLLLAAGLGGYWLPWDALAQFSVTATMEWLDALPLFGEPLARNFSAGTHVSDRLFSLLIFLHIGIPLALLAGMWVHIQRIAAPRTLPPRTLAIGFTLALGALCVVRPVALGAPADLATVAAQVSLDWFYQNAHPLFYATSGAWLWTATLGATLVLACLPWLPPARRPAAARVSLANCNGCGRCQMDCPYLAVTLQPRQDGRAALRQAVVDPALCAGCGICAGACPSSTPFRAGVALQSGIDMPERPLDDLRRELEAALAATPPSGAVIAFACTCGTPGSALADAQTAVIPVLCAGMVPPSFVEYALRSGAQGVLIAGCRRNDCAFRYGDRLTLARLQRTRAPRLRQGVDARRIDTVWAAATDTAQAAAALARLRTHLARLPPPRERRPKRRETLHD